MTKLTDTMLFLVKALSAGPQPTFAVEAAAKKYGITKMTFKRARAALSVISTKHGPRTYIRLPPLAVVAEAMKNGGKPLPAEKVREASAAARNTSDALLLPRTPDDAAFYVHTGAMIRVDSPQGFMTLKRVD